MAFFRFIPPETRSVAAAYISGLTTTEHPNLNSPKHHPSLSAALCPSVVSAAIAHWSDWCRTFCQNDTWYINLTKFKTLNLQFWTKRMQERVASCLLDWIIERWGKKHRRSMAPMYQCGWTMWLFNTLKNPLQAAGFLRAVSIILDESQNKRPNEPPTCEMFVLNRLRHISGVPHLAVTPWRNWILFALGKGKIIDSNITWNLEYVRFARRVDTQTSFFGLLAKGARLGSQLSSPFVDYREPGTSRVENRWFSYQFLV